MSTGKFPLVVVMAVLPLVVFTEMAAAQELFGAAMPSAGTAVAAAALVSVNRGNPNVVPIAVVSSLSKFFPVVLSVPLTKLTLASQIQFKNPPVEAFTVAAL